MEAALESNPGAAIQEGDPPMPDNATEWEGLQPVLAQLDPDAKLPQWAVIYDARLNNEERTERQKNEIATMDWVDRIFDQMVTDGLNERYQDTEGHPKIDQELRTWGKRIILSVNRIRYDQGLKAYTRQAVLMLMYEVWYADMLHRQHHRESGEYYARTHLFEALIILVQESGFTGLASLITILRHDDPEDLQSLHNPEPSEEPSAPKRKKRKPPRAKINKDLLLANTHYNWSILDSDDPENLSHNKLKTEIENIRTKVERAVRGVTVIKVEGGTRQEKQNLAIINLLGTIQQHGLRVAAIKGADRIHNMKTLEEKRDLRKRRGITQETAIVYVPILRQAGFKNMAERLLELSFTQGNPRGLVRFRRIQQQHFTKYLGERRERARLRHDLKRIAQQNPDIEYIAIRPQPLSQYADNECITEQDYSPEMDATDPGFEIYIQVRSPEGPNRETIRKERIDQARLLVYQTLKSPLGSGATEELGFSEDEGGWVEIDNPTLMAVPVRIRINDHESEAMKLRGYLRESDVENPPYIDAAIRRVLRKVHGRITTHNILDLIEEELLKPKKVVFQRDGKPLELLGTANGLDAAAAIHGDLLAQCIGIVIRTRRGSRADAKAISPFDSLPEGVHLNIATDKNDPDARLITERTEMDLGWMCFVRSHTQEQLARLFKKGPLPHEECEQAIEKHELYRARAMEYLERLAFLLNLTHEEEEEEDFNPRTNLNEIMRILLHATGEEGILRETEKWAQHLRRAQEQSRSDTDRITEILKDKKDKLRKKENQLLERIGKGGLNPVEVMAAYLEKEEETLLGEGITVAMKLPDLPGIAEKIAGEFRKDDLNIEDMGTKAVEEEDQPAQEAPRVPQKILWARLQLADHATLYDLMRCLLRISYKYPTIQVTTTNFRDAIPHP